MSPETLSVGKDAGHRTVIEVFAGVSAAGGRLPGAALFALSAVLHLLMDFVCLLVICV